MNFKKSQFGINLLLSTGQSVAINLILLSLGRSEGGASPLISTLQAFLMGATTGFIGASGQIIKKPPYTEGDARKDMANTQLIISVGLGLASGGISIGLNAILQYLLTAETATSTFDYYLGYAGNNVSTLLLSVANVFGQDFSNLQEICFLMVMDKA